MKLCVRGLLAQRQPQRHRGRVESADLIWLFLQQYNVHPGPCQDISTAVMSYRSSFSQGCLLHCTIAMP